MPDGAEQQIKLWLQLAHEAYDDRQIVQALHYFHRALNYAHEKGQDHEVALICRDLGYVYNREESLDRALAYSDQGLAIAEMDLSVRTGLMANKARALARLGAYRAALKLLKDSARLLRSAYRDFSQAPSPLAHSYDAIVRMAEDLGKIVDLLDMGVKADRIQVDFKPQEPPWPAGKQ